MSLPAVVEADTDGVIRRWDDGAEQTFGHSAGVAVGRRVDFIVPEHLRGANWAGFDSAMKDPQLKDLAADLPVLCADLEIRHFTGGFLALSDGLGVAIGAPGYLRRGGKHRSAPVRLGQAPRRRSADDDVSGCRQPFGRAGCGRWSWKCVII